MIRSGSQSHSTRSIRKLSIFGPGAFFTDWPKRALPILFIVTEKWAVPYSGRYSAPWNTGGLGKACALTNVSLACIVTAISLFGPISVGVVLFTLGLVYFSTVQHLFLSSGQIFAGSRVSSSHSKKISSILFLLYALNDITRSELALAFLYLV